MEHQKDFDNWNIEKQEINQKTNDKDFWFETREIWWCSLGINVEGNKYTDSSSMAG